MGRTVFCEEKLISVFTEKSNNGFIPGLIIGQSIKGKDYVTLLAPTPDFSELDSGAILVRSSYKSLKDFDDKWIAAHAESMKHSLTGGMNILGVFLIDSCSEGAVDESEAFSKLRSFTSYMSLPSKSLPYYKSYVSPIPLVLYYSVSSRTVFCKTVSGGALSGSLEPVVISLTKPEGGWLPVQCTLDLSLMDPFHVPPVTGDIKSLRILFKDVYQRVEGVIKGAAVAIEGRFISPGQLSGDVGATASGPWIENVRQAAATATKTKPTEGPALVSLYAPFAGFNDGISGDDTSKVTFCEREADKKSWNIVRPHGSLLARISVCSTTPLRDVVQFVKEDLLRCLSSKLELYAIDLSARGANIKANEDGVWSHDLPRRVVFGVKGSVAEMAEYVIGEEGTTEAAENLSSILCVTVNVNDIRCEDPSQLQVAAAAAAAHKGIEGKDNFKKVSTGAYNKTVIVVIGVSSLVLLASIIIHFIVK